ncbi:hypothetical protein OGM23_04435 [Dickeya fangzhongdai]|uniref:hypothetical protein n=1 Tax=Dickeya fangzhongdai TaxID=1778540 RepID=UPI002B28EA56|nr:hypothetical protein OGM23_04435 [Dickeya fangzhongdai]
MNWRLMAMFYNRFGNAVIATVVSWTPRQQTGSANRVKDAFNVCGQYTRSVHTVALSALVIHDSVCFARVDRLREALCGIVRLFISHGTSTEQVANEIALIDAAVAAGVRHIVKLSALGPATRLLPIAWYMQIEAIEPESQRAYHLTGPRAWTVDEVAAELTCLLGHQVTYVHISPAQQREALLGSGLSPFTADLLLGLDRLFRESAIGETTSTVEEMTGKTPRSLTGWLTDNLAILQDAVAIKHVAQPFFAHNAVCGDDHIKGLTPAKLSLIDRSPCDTHVISSRVTPPLTGTSTDEAPQKAYETTIIYRQNNLLRGVIEVLNVVC